MEIFLDTVHQNKFQTSMKLDSNWIAFDSRIAHQKINKTPSHKVCDMLTYGSFITEKGSRTPVLQEMPSLTSELSILDRSGLLENEHGQKKRMLSSCLEMNEDFLKEYNPILKKKQKTDSLTYVSSNKNTQLTVKELEGDGKLKFGPSSKANSMENPNLDETTHLQILHDKGSFKFPLEPNCSLNDPGQNNLQVPFDSHPEQRWRGFPNLGNTCYMNATLQSLVAIPSFANDLLGQDVPWENVPSDALILHLSQLLVLKDISSPEIKKKLLANVKNSISAAAEIFSSNMQNDAHEFLGQCLDQLKGDVEKLNTTLKTRWEPGEENLCPQISASMAATEVCVCPVVANFEFELKHSIVCNGCCHVIFKRELSNFLSIDLPQGMRPCPWSLQFSFDLFFKAEELEYNCEKCKHQDSVAVRKFSRLPRVLIVHLKRYYFNDVWLLVKDDQQVDIPRYLNLSCHYDESTKPPLSLHRNAYIGDSQVLKVSPGTISGTISPSAPPLKLISEPKQSLVLCRGSDKEAEPQRCPGLCERSSQEKQQNDQGHGSELNVRESELTNSGNGTIGEQGLPAADSVMGQKDSSPSVICEDGSKPTISQDTGLVEAPENPELEKSVKTNSYVELHFDGADGSTENFYAGKENRFPARSEVEASELKRNAKQGAPSHAYRLISVVSHIGSSPDSGHYISDVYDFERHAWLTYSDLRVSEIQEAMLQKARLCSGYIFFYMHNEIFEELFEKSKN